MRILLVNTRHFHGGGDSTYTLNLADLLRSNGHDVVHFAMDDARNLPDADADLFVSHIDFRALNRRRNPLAAIQVLGRSIYSVQARQKFARLLDRHRPDIVHLQNIHAHITPSIVFEARRRHLPVVWTLHDYKLICPNSHLLIDCSGQICEACGRGHFYHSILTRCKKGSLLASAMAALEAYAHRLLRVYDHVDAFLAPSNFLRSKLIDLGFPHAKVHHLPLFLPALPSLTNEATTAANRYHLFLGKLEPIKGIHILFEACRLAPEVNVVMAGWVDEPLASALPELLARTPNVSYVGAKPASALPTLLNHAMCLVLPSIWYENQPMSILEAFASSKPVIASNLGGMQELVGFDERGLLVQPGNAMALVAAMRWMQTHPHEAAEMGVSAHHYARTQHNADMHYQKLMALYSTLLKAQAHHSR